MKKTGQSKGIFVAFALASATTLMLTPKADADFFKEVGKVLGLIPKPSPAPPPATIFHPPPLTTVPTMQAPIPQQQPPQPALPPAQSAGLPPVPVPSLPQIISTVDQTGKAVTHGVDQTVKAAVIATQQAGHAIEKGAHDVGHGAEEVGKFVQKHPWETVAAVALIAGGGYLIVYEGYTLAVTVQGVTVVSITPGATGVVVGTAAAAGGGLVVDATIKSSQGSETTRIETPTSAPPIQTGEPVRGPTTISTTNAPKNVPVETVGRNEQSLVFTPTLSQKPTDVERLGFALWASDWAEKVAPLAAFDPTKSPLISPAELKLLEAMTELRAINAKDSDELANELHDEIHHPVSSTIKDQEKDLAKSLGWRILTRLSNGLQ